MNTRSKKKVIIARKKSFGKESISDRYGSILTEILS